MTKMGVPSPDARERLRKVRIAALSAAGPVERGPGTDPRADPRKTGPAESGKADAAKRGAPTGAEIFRFWAYRES